MVVGYIFPVTCTRLITNKQKWGHTCEWALTVIHLVGLYSETLFFGHLARIAAVLVGHIRRAKTLSGQTRQMVWNVSWPHRRSAPATWRWQMRALYSSKLSTLWLTVLKNLATQTFGNNIKVQNASTLHKRKGEVCTVQAKKENGYCFRRQPNNRNTTCKYKDISNCVPAERNKKHLKAA